jgi:hypothetical protein
MSLIPHDLDEWLDERLTAMRREVIHTTVDGVPIVGVPVEALVGDDLDEALAGSPLWELFPGQ